MCPNVRIHFLSLYITSVHYFSERREREVDRPRVAVPGLDTAVLDLALGVLHLVIEVQADMTGVRNILIK